MPVKIITDIEDKAETFWKDVSGAARKDLQQALADAKASLGQFAPLLQAFEAQLKSTIAAEAPQAVADVEALVAKLLADAGGLLGADLTRPQPAPADPSAPSSDTPLPAA